MGVNKGADQRCVLWLGVGMILRHAIPSNVRRCVSLLNDANNLTSAPFRKHPLKGGWLLVLPNVKRQKDN